MAQPHGEFDFPEFAIKLLSQGALYAGSSDPFAEVIVYTLASFANLIGKLIRVAGASPAIHKRVAGIVRMVWC